MKKGFLFVVASLSITALFSCTGYDYSVTVVFTNDTHGAINKTLSFANAGAIKQDLVKKNKNVLLLDSGDIISGGFYTSYDKGASMIKFMEEAGYDAATLGNHEFDHQFSYLDQVVKNCKFPFISTNLYHMQNNVPTTRYTDLASKTFVFPNNLKVGVIGVSTPESYTTSTPKYFQDDQGNYIYTFLEQNNQIYSVVQDEINKLKNIDRCKFVVCMSHLGDESQDNTFTATKLANHTSGIDVILDGHTHFADKGHTVKDKDNNDVLITQAGGTFSNIGKLTLSKLNKPQVELIKSTNLIDETLKEKEDKYIRKIDDSLSNKIATSEIAFNKGEGYKESNIGDLITEASYYYYNKYLEDSPCDLTVVNAGGIRASIDAGDWTKKSCHEIHSFGNGICEIEVDGTTLINSLEFAYHNLSNDPSKKQFFGGFLQLCGAKVTIDISKQSKVVVENGKYISGPSKEDRRVSVQIYDKTEQTYKDVEDEKTYIIGGSSYTLLNQGDGFTLLKDARKIREEGSLVDYDILELYISKFDKSGGELPKLASTNSPLFGVYQGFDINYETAEFGGRITTTS